MTIGPGKYDPLCTLVRERTHARGAIVIVIDGSHGSGFSVQGDMAAQMRLPDMLEQMAAQIRADMRRMPTKKAYGQGMPPSAPEPHYTSTPPPASPVFAPAPSYEPPIRGEDFKSGGGGDYAGAGASGSWEAAPSISAVASPPPPAPPAPEPPPPPPPDPPAPPPSDP